MSLLEKTHIKKPEKSHKSHKFSNLGFHVGRGKNIRDMIERMDAYRKAGFNTFQIFLNSPRQMLKQPSDKALSALDEFAKYIRENGINLYIHTPYTINLSSPYHRTAYWNTALIQELEMAERVGASGVVIHTGRYKDLGRDIGIANMIANLSYAVQMAKSSVRLLIETPAGQGTELGVEIEELAAIWKEIPSTIRKRLGICVDTCHIFAAGYDLRTKAACRAWLLKFDKLIGLEHLKFMHLNDSRMPAGSHLDRHAQLNDGEIGEELGILVGEFYKLGIPIIVETPGDFKSDVKILNKWIA